MIVNVYKQLMTQNAVVTPSSLTVKDIFGTSRSVLANTYRTYGGGNHIKAYPTSDNGRDYSHGFRIVFGTGSTPETADDFQLEAMADLLTCASNNYVSSFIRDVNDVVIGIKKSVTFVNNGTAAVTISEVGVVQQEQYGSSSSSANWFLMDRTVLDTPLVVEPSGTVTFDVSVIF